MKRPTVTYLGPCYLTNFKCYLTPDPEISVRGSEIGPSYKVHSPSNLAYPLLSKSLVSPASLSATTNAANFYLYKLNSIS